MVELLETIYLGVFVIYRVKMHILQTYHSIVKVY
jgi:hypothetical protein